DGFGSQVIKNNVQRPRPANTEGLQVTVRAPFGGYSFASNHATNMFSFASFTGAMFPPAAPPLYLLAATIGYSRIYNGVHFPTDVLVGALVGCIFGLSLSRACRYTLTRLKEKEKVTS